MQLYSMQGIMCIYRSIKWGVRWWLHWATGQATILCKQHNPSSFAVERSRYIYRACFYITRDVAPCYFVAVGQEMNKQKNSLHLKEWSMRRHSWNIKSVYTYNKKLPKRNEVLDVPGDAEYKTQSWVDCWFEMLVSNGQFRAWQCVNKCWDNCMYIIMIHVVHIKSTLYLGNLNFIQRFLLLMP